jgi:hypothetical protein
LGGISDLFREFSGLVRVNSGSFRLDSGTFRVRSGKFRVDSGFVLEVSLLAWKGLWIFSGLSWRNFIKLRGCHAGNGDRSHRRNESDRFGHLGTGGTSGVAHVGGQTAFNDGNDFGWKRIVGPDSDGHAIAARFERRDFVVWICTVHMRPLF